MTTLPCPTPDKIRYATDATAQQRAAARGAITGGNLTAYECPCGWWHLTARNFAAVGNPDATPATVAAMTDQEFAGLVERDIRGWATAAEAAALADPINAKQWADALDLIWGETKDALAAYAGDASSQRKDWRARHLAWRRRVRARREAARKAVAEARNIANRLNSEDALRARGAAGELAINRLIRAHRPEFDAYLADECEKAGVELPLRVRRYIAIRETRGEHHAAPAVPPAALAVIRAAIDTAPPGATTATTAQHIAHELADNGWRLTTDQGDPQ